MSAQHSITTKELELIQTMSEVFNDIGPRNAVKAVLAIREWRASVPGVPGEVQETVLDFLEARCKQREDKANSGKPGGDSDSEIDDDPEDSYGTEETNA